jgi:stage II sporulation protein P
MNSKQKYKNKEKIIYGIIKIILFMVLSYLAIRIGVFGGTLLSSADSQIVRNVDVENFKGALNNSFPIIDTIYNSGNISISFTGGIKSIIRKIYGFDLSDPITVLNAESPHIYSYYVGDYQKILAQNDRLNRPVEIKEDNSDDDNSDDDDNSYEDNNSDKEEKQEQNKDSTGLIQDQSSIYMEEDKEEDHTSQKNIVTKGKIVIDNQTKYKIDINELLNQPLNINFDKKGPKVLIYHTHTTESYINTLSSLNKSGVPSRNRDPKYGVVRVGDELAESLRKKYGMEVIHNGTVHDYPVYDGAYGRSLSTASKILKSYPSIKVALDIHRDALSEDKKLRAVTKIGGKNAAQSCLLSDKCHGLTHPN